MKKEKTELDYVDIIGRTLEDNKDRFGRCARASGEKIVLGMLKGESRGTIVDMGCSIGSWYHFVNAEKFQRKIGIDISKERLKEARRRGYETYNCRAQEIPLESNTVDVALSIGTFLHILQEKDREDYIKEAMRILKDDGVFILSFSNKKEFELAQKLRGIKEEKYNKFYTINEIKDMCERNGFVLEEIKSSLPLHFVLGRLSMFLPSIPSKYCSLIFFKLRKPRHLTRQRKQNI